MRFKKEHIAILILILLFVGRKFVCDFLYRDAAELYSQVYGYDVPNPYNKAYNLLRNKINAFERLWFITICILYLKPIKRWNFKSIREYFKTPEENVTVRLLIVFWLYSFGDTADRLIFNINEFQINDWLVHGLSFIYIIKTLKYAGQTKTNS